MFKIFADDLCFYDDQCPDAEYKLVSPKLKLTDNSAGSLTFTLPRCNVAYDVIQHLSTYIYVYQDGEEIWSGRVIDEKKDFRNNRTLTCEGRLAFLNDTTQPTWNYNETLETKTLRGLLEHYVVTHNSELDDNLAINTKKKFSVGYVSASLSSKWSLLIGNEPWDSDLVRTDYETTFECIRSKIIEPLGGHILVEKGNDGYVINYFDDSDATNTAKQSIEFGGNLTDFTNNYDMTSLVTAIVPLGAKIEDSDDRITIPEGHVSANGEVTSKFGLIYKVVEWGDVRDEDTLRRFATEYLESTQFDNMVLEIKAVDLHYLNPSIESLRLLDTVLCLSKPHGLNKPLMLTDMDIALDNPASTTYTLGKREHRTLSGISASSSSNTQTKFNWVLNYADDILKSAKENAEALMDARSTGYITFKYDSNGNPEEMYISNNKNYLQATKYWRWNMNGLAYYDTTTMSAPKTAWTMDGGFVADFITSGVINAGLITAGEMSANRIRGGYLLSSNYIADTQGSILYLDSGIFRTHNGNMGSEMANGVFRLYWNGNENAGYGTTGNGEPYIFYKESKTLHVGMGSDGVAYGDSIRASSSRLEFITYANGGSSTITVEGGKIKDPNGNEFVTANHAHTIASITGLQSALDGKANLSHTHGLTDVTGLQDALDGKAYLNHNHDGLYMPRFPNNIGGGVGGIQPASGAGLHSVYFDADVRGNAISYIAGTDLKDGLHIHDDNGIDFTVTNSKSGFKLDSSGGNVRLIPSNASGVFMIGDSSEPIEHIFCNNLTCSNLVYTSLTTTNVYTHNLYTSPNNELLITTKTPHAGIKIIYNSSVDNYLRIIPYNQAITSGIVIGDNQNWFYMMASTNARIEYFKPLNSQNMKFQGHVVFQQGVTLYSNVECNVSSNVSLGATNGGGFYRGYFKNDLFIQVTPSGASDDGWRSVRNALVALGAPGWN